MKLQLGRLLPMMMLGLCGQTALALGSDDVVLIAKAAERGSDASQVLLATAYLAGDGGLAKDPAKAAHWFEQAAIQGNGYAEEKLGDLYEQGNGVDKNLKLSFDWRLKAANRGILTAQVSLGKMYRDGQGVDKDINKAMFWFERAATEGNSEAQYLLGRMYHENPRSEAELAAGRSWLQKAARQGYDSAAHFLALVESIGYEIEETWYHRKPGLHKLANDGDPEAQYQLAQRYEQGVGGVRKDTGLAIDWYRRAANGGNRMAMRALSQIYGNGLDGVARDPAAAKVWAEKADTASK